MKFNNAVGPQVRNHKSRSKLLPIVAALSVMSGLQVATQYFAYKFGYHPSLGPNIEGVYAPWSILTWAYHWSGQFAQELMTAGNMGALVASVGIVGAGVAKILADTNAKANEFLHGFYLCVFSHSHFIYIFKT
jgi:type IV secretion system protein VirD4